MEELTGPSSRAEHQAQLVDKGKGKELGTDEAQGTWLPDITAKTTGVAMQKPGNEEDQNREKARGRSQSRHGRPVAKPVNASDQTSRGWSQSRRPTKKAKPVDEDVQDRRDINNPPKSWEVVPEAEHLFKGRGDKSEMQRKASRSRPRRQRSPEDTAGLPTTSTLAAPAPLTGRRAKRQRAPSRNQSAGPSKITSRHSSPGPQTGRPMEIITPSWLSWSRSHARSAATDPPITPAPTTTTGADDPCHCDEYREEVTILKRENADMRREIEVTRTELAALHRVVDAIRNHLFPAPDVLNHPLVPFHATSNPTPRFNHPEAAQDRSPLNPPPASFKGGAGLEVPPSNVKPVHGPAGGPAISITPPPPAVGSAPEQEGRMEVD
ncbi:hypothetical protein BKA82DRAFT_4363365 [Pisolithus tinctorius]|nr:hypothetical protein BKA82DRAFT_4363365 [Pisolithus tinctorius]